MTRLGAWEAFQQAVAESPVDVRVLDGDEVGRRRCVKQMGFTSQSVLGAVISNCGGFVVDGGWVRVLGGGADGLPDIGRVNGFPGPVEPGQTPARLIVGYDVLGGVFALNFADPADAGPLGIPEAISYFAPDSLRWEPLELPYSTWVFWLLSGQLELFYKRFRWDGWREEIAGLGLDEGISTYPHLWTVVAYKNPAGVTRTPVPMRQLLDTERDFALRRESADPGRLGDV
ncbi:DUF2625 family protein [Streptomyces acidiscabies]|uniref:DUF2625 domain-containing protein n=1 Tax=Streptomyces acidiscabies TaxID=42234 RepID=A0A0L0KAS6_9ACTN|nr:DUF2625 family protein [Streptomyces acidiscabies]KND35202.1 hypothetical protein IQ63_15050 [Streptomyces acidiscabies]